MSPRGNSVRPIDIGAGITAPAEAWKRTEERGVASLGPYPSPWAASSDVPLWIEMLTRRRAAARGPRARR